MAEAAPAALGKTAPFGVLGHPVGHSLSPAMHRAMLESAGVDTTYGAFDVDAGELAPFLAERSETWRGFSVTMPLKVELARLASSVDDTVRLTGAANTALRAPDGSLRACNTDVDGIVRALEGRGVRALDRAHLWGAGATTRSALVACARLGARSIEVRARRREQIDEAVAFATSLGMHAAGYALDEPPGETPDLVISTLPGTVSVDLSYHAAPPLFDVAYSPWPTPAVAGWRGEVIPGIDMLLWQGVRQAEMFYGIRATADIVRAAADAVRHQHPEVFRP